MKTPRAEVYNAIDGERDYQDKLGCDRTEQCSTPVAERSRTVGEYLTMLDSYLRKAQDAWTFNAGDFAALDEVRKVAAIAVHCMEDNGVAKRVVQFEADIAEAPAPEKMFFKIPTVVESLAQVSEQNKTVATEIAEKLTE